MKSEKSTAGKNWRERMVIPLDNRSRYNPPKITGWLSRPEGFPLGDPISRIEIYLSDEIHAYWFIQSLSDAQLLDKVIVCILPAKYRQEASHENTASDSLSCDAVPVYNCYIERRRDGSMCCSACGRTFPGKCESESSGIKNTGWLNQPELHPHGAMKYRLQVYLSDALSTFQVIQTVSDAQLLDKVGVSIFPAVQGHGALPENNASDHQDNPVVRTCYLERRTHWLNCMACTRTIPSTPEDELDLVQLGHKIARRQW